MNEYDINLPSGRILFALEALEEFEAKPGCSVDMKRYHEYEADTCFAGLGGAAALKYYKISESYYKAINSIADIAAKACVVEREVAHFEASLNWARLGKIGLMFHWMHLPEEEDDEKYNCNITSYHVDREEFYADMHQLAEDLSAWEASQDMIQPASLCIDTVPTSLREGYHRLSDGRVLNSETLEVVDDNYNGTGCYL